MQLSFMHIIEKVVKLIIGAFILSANSKEDKQNSMTSILSLVIK